MGGSKFSSRFEIKSYGGSEFSMIDISSPIYWGRAPWSAATSAAPAPSTMTIDAAGEIAAFVFIAPKTGTLSKVRFRLSGVTTAQDLKVSFQDLSSGNPDGTPDQYRVVPSASVAVGFVETGILSDDGTDGGTKRSVTIGDALAVVVEFNSAVGNVQVSTQSSNAASIFGHAYSDLFTASWAKNTSQAPLFALEYSDGSVEPIAGVLPGTYSNVVFNSGSSPDEYGNVFTLPFSARVSGIWAWVDYDNAADLVLYSGTSALATIAVPASTNRPGTAMGFVALQFPTPQTLAAGVYRAVLKPGASNVGINLATLAAAADLAAHFRSDFYGTSRTDAGAWSDDTTTVYQIGPIIDQINAG